MEDFSAIQLANFAERSLARSRFGDCNTTVLGK